MKKFPLDGSVFEEKDKLVSLLKNILLFTAAIGGSVGVIYLLYLAANAYAGTGVKFFYPRLFGDFTQVAYYSIRKDAYLLEGGSSYSALSLLLLAPFALIFKKDLDKIEYIEDTSNWGMPNMQIISSWRFWVAFLLYQAVCFICIYFLIRRMAGNNKKEGRDIFLIFLCCAPNIYALKRGNIILAALIFSLIFLNWYKDEKAWKREAAILSLAVSGVLKLYPLFFCAFLLHDKKWFRTARMFFYFVLLYLLPILFYEGGFSAYFENLLAFAGGKEAILHRSNISLASFLYKIIYQIAQFFHTVPPVWVNDVCIVLGFIFLFFLAVAAVVTEDSLKRALLSACAIALVPSVSYCYVAIFALIPFMEYLKEFEKRNKKENKVFLLSCLLLFFYPLYSEFSNKLLFSISAIVFILLGIVACIKIFRQREFGRYMSDLKKQFRKKEERQ